MNQERVDRNDEALLDDDSGLCLDISGEAPDDSGISLVEGFISTSDLDQMDALVNTMARCRSRNKEIDAKRSKITQEGQLLDQEYQKNTEAFNNALRRLNELNNPKP